jgi:hypothetical protein
MSDMEIYRPLTCTRLELQDFKGCAFLSYEEYAIVGDRYGRADVRRSRPR